MHCPLTNINSVTQDTKCHYVILGGTLQIYPTLLRSILFILFIYDFVSLLLSALLLVCLLCLFYRNYYHFKAQDIVVEETVR